MMKSTGHCQAMKETTEIVPSIYRPSFFWGGLYLLLVLVSADLKKGHKT